MAVVLIIGVLVAMAIPLYISARGRSEQTVCFSNQQTLERAVEVYLGADPTRSRGDLVGIVTAAHPVVVENIVGRPPRCPSAPKPVDASSPTVAEGAYTYTATGTIEPCTHGALGPHGHY